jgi:hypothetical protein
VKKAFYYILPLVLLVAICMTCNKGSDTTPSANIIGTWQLVSANGGFTGGPIPLPSYVVTYTFKADSTFSQTPSKRTGTFHITRQKSIFTGDMQPFITFSE